MRITGTARQFFALSVALFVANAARADLHYQVEPQIISTDSPRLGVNLGDWVSWGAAQLPSNVLKNPGFEGLIDRAIVVVKTADAKGFADDTVWTKRPDGFWAGARYDVRSSSAAGRKRGVLFDSFAAGNQGFPSFTTVGKAPTLNAGDIVSLTRINDKDLPSHWWFAKNLLPGQLTVVTDDKRPDSPGLRALALKPLLDKPVEVLSYLDAIGDRAGKLLPINGTWKVRFWLRQTQPGATITVRFRRLNGSQPFFQETFQPTPQWQAIERSFNVQDDGAAGTLELSLLSEGKTGAILLDDMELGAVTNTTASAFRPELVAALKRLQPGYLRDWQGQLGDTFDNRNADVFARRASRYRPGDESTFSYSLDEFFQLAQTVGAQPWIIVPPTMGDQELQKLGRLLSKRIKTFHFQEILVEFGNENWNSVFRPAGIPDYRAHGLVATRAFQQLMIGAKNNPALRTVVNGQYVNPWLSAKFLDGVPNANALAIAPYFLFKLDEADNIMTALFDQDNFYRETLAATQARGKELMVYEVNLHTTSGDASVASRDIATTSSAAGAALAKRLLTGLNLGIKQQCLYTLAQYDAFFEPSQGKRELLKLWGIVRDLGDTQRFRPTGLAMAMLNQLLPADVYSVKNLDTEDKTLTLTAFHNSNGWALAAVSAKATPQTITVQFPIAPTNQGWRLLRLASESPTATNESEENVRIVEEHINSEQDSLVLTLPAYGFVVVSVLP
jgi:hypothetical protein